MKNINQPTQKAIVARLIHARDLLDSDEDIDIRVAQTLIANIVSVMDERPSRTNTLAAQQQAKSLESSLLKSRIDMYRMMEM